MFNQKFVDFLKILNKISNGVLLEYPVSIGKTDCSDIWFRFDISKFDDTEFKDKIGFMDLSSFLNVFNLVDEPEVSLSNGVVIMKDKNSKVSFLTTAQSIMGPYVLEDPLPAFFDKLDKFPTIAEIPISASDIRRIRQASSSFKEANVINFKGDDSVKVSLTTKGKFNQSSNTFDINKDIIPKKNFDLYIKLETFSKLPVLDYVVKVKYNEARGKFKLWVETSIDGFVLLMSTDDDK